MSPAPGTQHGARHVILGKIRRALQIPAPRPGAHSPGHTQAAEGAVTAGQEPGLSGLPAPVKAGSQAREGEAQGVTNGAVNGAASDTAPKPKVLASLNVLSSSEEWRQWLPPAGEGWEDWARLFAVNAEGLRAEFHLLETLDALPAAVRTLAAECGWTAVALHEHPLLNAALAEVTLPQVRTDVLGYDRDTLAACEVGFSACDALIAQTGTVLLGCTSGGGRALSVLPPHHVVVARRDQLLPDLPAAFALLHETYGQSWPSSITFITGPSRTGDIERILVLGAHGPKRLTIFCV